MSKSDIVSWKEDTLKELNKLGVGIGRRKDDASARRIAIVVGESFGRAFSQKIEINKLVAAISALECQTYLLAKETRLICSPLERELPPSSYKGGTADWRNWQLKLPDFGDVPARTERTLAQEILTILLEEGETDANGGVNNRSRALQRIGNEHEADDEYACSRTHLYQSGQRSEGIRRKRRSPIFREKKEKDGNDTPKTG